MERIGKRLTVLLLALALAGFPLCGRALAAMSTEEMVAQAKWGVVQIYGVGVHNGERSGWRGTGFAVGPAGEDSDVFVTNWHVVTGDGEYDLSEVKIYIALENASIRDAYKETDRVIPCEVLYITSGNPDMAILRAAIPVSGYKALPLLSADEIMDAAHVVALGYPGVLDDFSSTNGGVDDISATQGYIVRHAVGAEDDADLGGTKLLFFDAVISGGNSGGPLLNDNGAVVGINTYGFGREATTDYSGAVYIDYAMEALDSLGLPYEVYQDPQEEPEPLPVVPLVIGAVILAAVVVLAVVLLRRKAKVPVAVGASEASDPPAKEKGGWRRKEPGFTLVGPGGQSTPIPASGLVIGRDPSQCTLCLPGETKGVSRRHCQVTIADGALLLTDLGSSYGTFTAGQRLEPNRPVPLSPGGSFYLGDATITFRVQ